MNLFHQAESEIVIPKKVIMSGKQKSGQMGRERIEKKNLKKRWAILYLASFSG